MMDGCDEPHDDTPGNCKSGSPAWNKVHAPLWDEYAPNTNGIILTLHNAYNHVLLDLQHGTPSADDTRAHVSLDAGETYTITGSVYDDTTVTFKDVTVAGDKSSVTFTVEYTTDLGSFYANEAPYPTTRYVTYPASTVTYSTPTAPSPPPPSPPPPLPPAAAPAISAEKKQEEAG